MVIGLIQEKQNALYQFGREDIRFTRRQALALQKEMVEKNLAMMRQAAERDCDLLVTSEAFNYAGQPGKVDCPYEELIPEAGDVLFKELSETARRGKCYLAAGVLRKERTAGGSRLYNSIFFYGKDRRLLGVYDKIHLAGEENFFLTPGEQYQVVETEYGGIGMGICWDMQFPETAMNLASAGADLIVVPTWGWEEIYGHARAYENGIYVAAAMAVPYQEDIEGLRTPSEVVGPLGEVLTRGGRGREEVVYCTIPDIRDCKESRKMLY